MLRWIIQKLFRRRIVRTAALENYLKMFSVDELSYLNDQFVSGVALTIAQKSGDAFPDIEIVSFIQAEIKIRADRLESDPSSYTTERTKVRLALAHAATTLGLSSGSSIMSITSGLRPFYTHIEAASEEDERRLGFHSTMISRIYRDGHDALLLPELDNYGEASNWEQHWRE